MLYQYALPRALDRYRGMEIRGRVAYPDHTVDIPAEAVDEEFILRPSGADTEADGRDTGPAGAIRAGVPILRHHGPGLPGAGGGRWDPRGTDRGFLSRRPGAQTVER